jgi:hypothetical protein
MSDLFYRTIPVYKCLACGQNTSAPHTDGYDQDFCPDETCRGNLGPARMRDPEYVTVALYEIDREYGGPEEGGWWYDVGTLIPGTQRSFLAEDAPQAQVYVDTLAARYPYQRGWISRGEVSYVVRVWKEREAPAGFPRVRPRYC